MSVNCNAELAGEMSPIQFSCDCNYSLITLNKTPVHSTWGLLSVCAACWTPHFEFRAVAYPGIFRGMVQQIQLRTEDRENGDLGAEAP